MIGVGKIAAGCARLNEIVKGSVGLTKGSLIAIAGSV